MLCIVGWIITAHRLGTAWARPALFAGIALAWAGLASGQREASVPALPPALDVAVQAVDRIPLRNHFSLLEDPQGELRWQDAEAAAQAQRFAPVAPAAAGSESVELGFTRSVYWLRLPLTNRSARDLDRLLEIAYPVLTRIDLYQVRAGQLLRHEATGIDEKFSTRAYAHRNFVFPLQLAAQASDVVYLRIRSIDSIIVPARLWEPAAFHAYERSDYALQALYFGIGASMLLFNLLLYLGGVRDRVYLLYIGFGLCMLLTVAAFTGLAKQYLWPELTWPSNVLLVAGFALAFASLLMFMRRMLRTAEVIPRLDRLLGIAIVVLASMPPLLFVSLQSFIKLAAVSYAVTAVLTLAASLTCLFKRERAAYFFVAAFLALMLGNAMVVLRAFGVLPSNVFTANGMQLGSVVEMFLLALALADRFNLLRRDRDAAQRAAFVAQNELVDTLRHSERELEARVQERTAELSASLARLQLAQDELVESAKLAALGAMVAGVAHELNTPIGNAVMSASSLEAATRELQSEFNAGTVRRTTLQRYLDQAAPLAQLVQRACHRAAELIASFKRVAVDQTSEQRRRFDLRDTLDDHLAALLPSYKDRPVRVELAVPAGIECEGYPGPLGQVVSNLVQNALIHAFEGRDSGLIRIEAEPQAEMVLLRVRDDGIGLSTELQARVFEPFFTTKFGRGGSGLGLAVVNNLVVGVLGGRVSLESTPGQGTSFVLWFPRLAAETAPGDGRRVETQR